MLELPLMHFNTEDIRIKPLFCLEDALGKIKEQSADIVPQKVLDVYGELYFPPAPSLRPYTFASIVLSSDGKMAYPDNPKGPVIASANRLDQEGGVADFWILNMLRSYSDAVIVGARTLQAEPDGTSHVFCEELAAARTTEMKKKTIHPVNVVISLDGTDIPLEHKIFTGKGLFSLIATSEAGGRYLDKALGGRPHVLYGPYYSAGMADAEKIGQSLREQPGVLHIIITGRDGNPDSDVLFSILRGMGIERLCIEAPSYMWHLLQKKALDEIFINYSMLFAGGPAAMGLNQPFTSTRHPHADFLMLGIHRQNFIYTRQRLRYEDPV